MKYVVIEVTYGAGKSKMTAELPIMFPNALVHADVARQITDLYPAGRAKVVAAGEYSPMDCTCSGYSESLKIGNRGATDTRLIQFCDYGVGMG